jgi:hypothetical protein
VDGHSPIVGRLDAGQEGPWLRLHDGLREITGLVTLPDLAVFQAWVPHVRRFSYFSR